MRKLFLICIPLLLVSIAVAQETEQMEVSILWFDDSRESEVLEELIAAFEAENTDIDVTIDLQAVGDITNTLPRMIESGQTADLVRQNRPSLYRDAYLDLRPYLSDPDAWAASFPEAYLASMRDDVDDGGLHGFPTDVTVSAPYINRDLWEAAGVTVPIDEKAEVTWEEWITAATEVQAALSTRDNPIYAVAMDRSGHRFWGPSLSRCAHYVDGFEDLPQIDTDGFRQTVDMLRSWHQLEITPLDVWGLTEQDSRPAVNYFIEGQLAFYFSGNWNIARFGRDIGENFNWEPVPNPVGVCGRTGMVGGNSLTAMNTAEHPEAVGRVVDYLTSDAVLAEFYQRNYLLPGDLDMAEEGLTYDRFNEELNQFGSELNNALEEAYTLQFRTDSATIHEAIRDGLAMMIENNLSVEDTVDTIEQIIGENNLEREADSETG